MRRTRLRFSGRDEWLEARKQGIGASEAATVVGLNPWETPLQLWMRKTGRTPAPAENEAMMRGHILEDGVARWWASQTGYEIIKSSADDFMFTDPDRPWLRVSPDRVYWLGSNSRSDNDKGIMEAKTTNMVIDPDEIPIHWFCQVQLNLGVSGYREGSLAWLSSAGGFNFGYRDIHFVPDFYEWISDEVSKFWIDNILGDKEPEAVNAQDVMLKYPVETYGKLVTASDEIGRAWTELKDVKAELAALNERKTKLEDSIKLAFGDAEKMVWEGRTIATWKATAPVRNFDAKAFAAANPETASQWTRETRGARRFLVK